jgi:hypothetical protein
MRAPRPGLLDRKEQYRLCSLKQREQCIDFGLTCQVMGHRKPRTMGSSFCAKEGDRVTGYIREATGSRLLQ